MSENKNIKMTLASGTVIEGTAEELAKLQKLFPSEEKPSELVPGDYAKVIGPTCLGDISEGTIVKIIGEKDLDGEYEINFADTSKSDHDYAKPTSLEKVELSESDLLFVKNGREIAEFKVGDIAEVLEDVSGSPVSTLVEIQKVRKHSVTAKGWSTVVGEVYSDYVYEPKHLKLVVLAENRADTVA